MLGAPLQQLKSGWLPYERCITGCATRQADRRGQYEPAYVGGHAASRGYFRVNSEP